MNSNKENTTDLNSGYLITFLYTWRKPIIIVTVLGAVISIIASLFIQNKYKSTVVLFPTVTNSVSKLLLSPYYNPGKDILKYGEEEEAEQMLQILDADEIRDKISAKYNLLKHYDIDENATNKKTLLKQQYESNVTFNRTKFMSVEINVLDHNPDTAAMIANDVAAYIDTVKNRMKREIADEALQIIQDEYNEQVSFIKELDDSLKIMRDMGIIDVEVQTERLTEQMAIAILEGKKNAEQALKNKLDTLGKYSGKFSRIQYQIEKEQDQLMLIRSRYREAEIEVEKSLQHKFIVNKATPAEKKSYPIRWLIVVISTFASFLFAITTILILESLKSAKLK
ncbi:MAG: hypothetical protein J5I47_00980 [Vicingus serpentipes]|nr:hypothetical protein [Vicingus serpentipes]